MDYKPIIYICRGMGLVSGRASGRKNAAPILFLNIPGKGVL